MKRLLMLVAAIAGISLAGGKALAANPAEVEVWVMITNLSVAITSSTTYSYGAVVAGSTALQPGGSNFVIQNNGNVAESFQLSVLSASNALLTGGGLWALVAGAPVGEQVRLCALFTAGPTVAGDFNPAFDALTTAPVTAGSIDAAPFSFVDVGVAGGNAVAQGASRNLWTRIETSATTVQFTNKFLRIQVNAI